MKNQSRSEALRNFLKYIFLFVGGFFAFIIFLNTQQDDSPEDVIVTAAATVIDQEEEEENYILESNDFKLEFKRFSVLENQLYVDILYHNKDSEPTIPYNHYIFNVNAYQEDDNAIYDLDLDFFADDHESEYDGLSISAPKIKQGGQYGFYVVYDLVNDEEINFEIKGLFASDPDDSFVLDLDEIEEVNSSILNN